MLGASTGALRNRIGITRGSPPSDEDEPIVLRSASRAISCHSLARCQYLTRMSRT